MPEGTCERDDDEVPHDPLCSEGVSVSRFLAWLGIGVSAVLYFWATSVWGRCGYDCSIFGRWADGPAAVAASFCAMAIFAVSLLTLVVTSLLRWRERRAERLGR